jgi:hypothetical protein
MVVEIVKIQKQRKNHKKEKLKLMKAKKCNVKSRRITPTQQRKKPRNFEICKTESRTTQNPQIKQMNL